jgi:hypothetical protein
MEGRSHNCSRSQGSVGQERQHGCHLCSVDFAKCRGMRLMYLRMVVM